MCLDAGDAVELGELLEFLRDWLACEGAHLAASFRGFVGDDPSQYPSAHWFPYDSLVRGAAARGLRVMFLVGGRAPDWADGSSNTVPVQIFVGEPSGTNTALRWGDTLAVRGGGTNTQIALDSNSREAKGFAGALRLIQHQPHGSLLLGITAAGLLAFGIYGVAEATFGRIATPSPHHARLAG